MTVKPLELTYNPLTWRPNSSISITILLINRGGHYAGVVGAHSEEAKAYYGGAGERLRALLVHRATATIDHNSLPKYFSDLIPLIPIDAVVDRWWAAPTSLSHLNDPSGSLNDAVVSARFIAATIANVPEADVPSVMPDAPEKQEDWKVVDPTVRTIRVEYDGKGWVVSAGKLIRPFRFAGHIAAEQYAAQIGERYNLPVKVV